jgi:CheY-like chemotaxis protein
VCAGHGTLYQIPRDKSPLAGDNSLNHQQAATYKKLISIGKWYYDINRAIMANQLKGNGARVLEAADGETAVALAAEPGLDLILMDIQMPGMDGFEAIEAIRRMSCGARLPILGFTASADRPTRQRILRVGADGVLTKPIGEAELVQAIRRALRQVKTGHRR